MRFQGVLGLRGFGFQGFQDLRGLGVWGFRVFQE